jgi:hypothetical protein
VTVGAITTTTVVLMWNDIPSANSYKVQQSVDAGATWVDVTAPHGGQPTLATTTVTTLTTATTYKVRVAGVFGASTGDYSSPVSVTTS